MGIFNSPPVMVPPLTGGDLSLTATTRPHLTLRRSEITLTSSTSFRPPRHHGPRATTVLPPTTLWCHATHLWCHATHLWCIVAHLCILLHITTVTSFAHLVTLLPTVTSMCAATHHQLHYLIFGGFRKHFFADRVLFSMATSFWHWLLSIWMPRELLFR